MKTANNKIPVTSVFNESEGLYGTTVCRCLVRRPHYSARLKPVFHISGKSQTIEDFTVSRLSQIVPTNEKLEIVDIPDRLRWTGTNPENRERFYSPDGSQISAMVGDHSRQMKTQICTVGDVGDGFRSLPIP